MGAVVNPTLTWENPSPCARYPFFQWIANAASRFTNACGVVTEQDQ